MENPTPPLQKLLESACERRTWTPVDLHAELKRRKVKITLQGVCRWFKGGGMRDGIKPAVASALEIPLNDLLRAAAGVAPDQAA